MIDVDAKISLKSDFLEKTKKLFVISFVLLIVFYILKILLAKFLVAGDVISGDVFVFFYFYEIFLNILGCFFFFFFFKLLFIRYKYHLNPKIFKV